MGIKSSDGFSVNEVWEILKTISDKKINAVLAGGQALAFWADAYEVPIDAALQPYLTEDIDLMAGRSEALMIADKFGGKATLAKLDDHTVNSAVIIVDNYLGRKLKIDCLWALTGLDENEVRKKAVLIKHKSGFASFLVMHPMYCLESRFKNLVLLPEKRTTNGISQAKLSIDVMRAHFNRLLAEEQEKNCFPLIERVADLAASEVGQRLNYQYGLDPLQSVPVEKITHIEFKTQRWPQIVNLVNEKRGAFNNAQRRLENQQKPRG